jgi:ParB family chromosome partitioning protein
MARRRAGLGKGLGALIPDGEDEAVGSAAGVSEVSLAAISPNPHQPRAPIREEDLAELAASIEEHGIIQPLLVTRSADGYQLIAGERRWRAARLAGLATVPVVVREAAPNEVLELALVENVQRADLNALEEAMAYQELVDRFGLKQEDVARRVGKSRVAVSNTLRLLGAAKGVKEALLAGAISEGHARALLGLSQKAAQEAALKTVVGRALSVRQTEELVRSLLGRPEKKGRAKSGPSPQTRALEDQLREALGTKVTLSHGAKGGRIVIYFYSDEELDALLERLGSME